MVKKYMLIALGALIVGNQASGAGILGRSQALTTALSKGQGLGGLAAKASFFTVGVIPGQTAGFDFDKFKELKYRYLGLVDQAILLQDLKGSKTHNAGRSVANNTGLDEIIKANDNQLAKRLYGYHINQNALTIIEDQLRKCGVDPSALVIYKGKSNCWGSVIRYDNRTFLGINSDLVFYNSLIGQLIARRRCLTGSAAVTPRDFLKFVVGHEASHILHKDHRRSLSGARLEEKRADLFGVFHSSNPLGIAAQLERDKKIDAKRKDLYIHTSRLGWHNLVKDLDSCYTGEELRQAITKDCYGYPVVKIEHL